MKELKEKLLQSGVSDKIDALLRSEMIKMLRAEVCYWRLQDIKIAGPTNERAYIQRKPIN